MKRPLEHDSQRRERMNVLAQDRELIRWSLSHYETLATKADEQREGTDLDPLGALVRAHAGELCECPPKVRKITHTDWGRLSE